MKARFQTLALAVVSTLLAVILVSEIGLRVREHWWKPFQRTRLTTQGVDSHPYFDPDQFFGQHSVIAKMEFSTFLGYVPIPSQRSPGVVVNAQRLRYTEDLTVAKSPEEIRVLVLGGSTAWGAGVTQAQLYTTVAEEALRQALPGQTIRVIAAGVGGYVSTQERIFLETYLLDLDPDVVVLFTGANDIYNGYRGNDFLKNQDFFRIRDALRRASDPLTEIVTLADPMRKIDKPLFGDYRLKTFYMVDRISYWFGRSTRERGRRDFGMAPNALFNKSRRNIAEVIDLGARHGFRVVLYLQPHLAATKKVLTQWEEHLLAESERFYPDWNAYCRLAYPVYRAGLRALADEGAARFTDADDAISDEQQSVFVDGFHLGDRGNKLLGEHLSSLLQQGFVAGRPER